MVLFAIRWPSTLVCLSRETGGRAGRVSRLGAAGSLGAVWIAGHKRGLVRGKKHGTKSGSGGLLLNENVMDFAYDCRFLLLLQSVCDYPPSWRGFSLPTPGYYTFPS